MINGNKKADHSAIAQLLTNTIVAPGCAALVDRIMLHPFDTIASFQQKYNFSFAQSVKNIYGKFGFGGFYKGLSPVLLLSGIPGHVIFFGSYVGVKEKLYQSGFTKYHFHEIAGSASTALLTAFLSAPIEAKRIRDTFEITHNIDTPRARYYYKGFLSLAIKSVAQFPIALAGTDILKAYFVHIYKHTNKPTLKTLANPDGPYASFCCGFLMGAIAQAVTNPLEVIKTRVMADYGKNPLSFWQHAKNAYQEKALFVSAATRLGRWGTSIGLAFSCMSLFNSYFQKREEKDIFCDRNPASDLQSKKI